MAYIEKLMNKQASLEPIYHDTGTANPLQQYADSETRSPPPSHESFNRRRHELRQIRNPCTHATSLAHEPQSEREN